MGRLWKWIKDEVFFARQRRELAVLRAREKELDAEIARLDEELRSLGYNPQSPPSR